VPLAVSEDRVIGHVAGLRPFRRSGFNVGVERAGEQIVVHNYGHGGGGVSLSWGTAALAVEHALDTPFRDAAVVGCGVVGLSTARLLQRAGVRVTIYARDLPPHTTSNVAGASWGPYTVVDPDRRTPAFDGMFVRAARLALQSFEAMASPRYGMAWRDTYVLSDGAATGFAAPSVEDVLLDGIRPAAESLAAADHPFAGLSASRLTTLQIQPAIYLDALLRDFREAGGGVVIREFVDRRDLATLSERLVVNCAGLGAAHLFDDADLVPVKGQLVVLAPQPDVGYLTIGPGDLYMMPREDGVILGGTHERGVWSLDPDEHEARRILAGHRALFARVRGDAARLDGGGLG
jgi:glycine/D-amino acid oxidase-like deaminating enzyme